ncbi:hypothetical protein LguiB_030546 [Lonicera macranthoides]
MLKILTIKLKLLCSHLPWPIHHPSNPNILITNLIKSNPNHPSSSIHPNTQLDDSKSQKPIRIATFNAALFSMAPAVPSTDTSSIVDFNKDEDYTKDKTSIEYNLGAKSLNDRPKSILKQSPLHSSSMRNTADYLSESDQQRISKSKLRVSINLPDNEISLKRSGQLSFVEDEKESSSSSSRIRKGKAPLTSPIISSTFSNGIVGQGYSRSRRSVVEVLRELDADILALQDVKAEEETGMKPLADLADALGMNYAFAESWAPQYGNAILSKWPIKRWKAQRIFDETDFRNVLKATIDVPHMGEVDFHCTHLDHLNENWRMKQINAIIESNDRPHILAGGLNSLDETDYSPQRWTDIVKMGKPTPKAEVMRFLKSKQYADAKDYAGECESVVIIAKGQSVQGTCKYGTRVDYLLVSPDSPYKFVPGSYSVLSSKGTSDHHIVKVDLVRVDPNDKKYVNRKRQSKQRVVKITNSSSSSKELTTRYSKVYSREINLIKEFPQFSSSATSLAFHQSVV